MGAISDVQGKLSNCNSAYDLINSKLEKYKTLKANYDLFSKVRTDCRGSGSWKEEALNKTPSDLTSIFNELERYPERVKSSVNWSLGKVTPVEDISVRRQIEEYHQKLAKYSDVLTIQCFANQYFNCFDLRQSTRSSYNEMFSKVEQVIASSRAKLEELDKQRKSLVDQIQEEKKMDVDES